MQMLSRPTRTVDLPTPPDRSLAQRMAALERANDVRTGRARLKRDIKAGRRDMIDVLLNPPVCADTMKVFDLLLAAPKIGRVKANQVLVRARVSPSKTVGGLTQRQRTEVALITGRRRPW